MGVGRSGSTVMDTVLGNHPDAVSVGELFNLPRLGWVGNNYCACGSRCGECDFWNEVRATWLDRAENATVETFIQAQSKFEFFPKLGAGKWGRLRQADKSPELQQFLFNTREMLAAIRKVSGKQVIVDSSKNPLRAALLAKIPDVDVSFVHLVRDGRAVAWSQMKAYQKNEKAGIQVPFYSKPSWRTIGYWAADSAICDRIRRQNGDRCRMVRYEDFVADPETALGTIGRVAGLDYSSVASRLASGDAFEFGHTVAGNRVRMSGQIRLKADLEWTEKLPKLDRWLCWQIASGKLKQYGYEKHIQSPIELPDTPRQEAPLKEAA